MREDNAQLSRTVTYTYDKGGNITQKSVYPFTTGTVGTATDTIAYTYDSTWKDRLASYDGKTLICDEIGNPYDYTHDRWFWRSTRELRYAYLTDDETVEYRYNENGLRSLKRIYNADWSDSDDYYYFWSDDGRLLAYTVDPMGSADLYSVLVLYNSNKEPIGFTVGEDTYYYLKNIQGDVLTVTDAEGTPIVDYTYDAWGMMTVSPASQNVPSATVVNVAFLNPVTYRGYFYDYELGLYYLQSRYYDPETGRFISADMLLYGRNILGYNLYSALYNNPVMYRDSSGGMATMFLNTAAKIYSAGIMNSKVLSGNVLLLNGRNIYLAFHEMAQIFVYRKLQSEGYSNIELEKRINNKEADIVARKNGIKYLWEIKPLGGESPEPQLREYTNGTGYRRGKHIPDFQVNVFNSTKMKITSNSSGGIYYAFYNSKRERIPNSQLYAKFRRTIISASAIVGGLIVATLLEDVVTGGAGIWDDAMVFLEAYSIMSPIVFGAV